MLDTPPQNSTEDFFYFNTKDEFEHHIQIEENLQHLSNREDFNDSFTTTNSEGNEIL